MNKFITKQGSRLAAFAVGLVLFSSAAEAQNLVIGTTGVMNNQGTIKFRSDNGNLENNAPIGSITNDGNILILGTTQTFNGTNTLTSTSALRIPGKVTYGRVVAGAQRVFNGYYDDVTIDGASTKDLTHNAGVNSFNYFVGGDYTITATAGNRNYAGSTFTYDGGTGTTGAATQTVAGENGTNGTGYNNLAFAENALKTLSSVATASGTTNVLATTGGGAGGVIVTGATGSLTSTGNFTQAPLAGDYSINLGASTTLNGSANSIGALVAVNDGTLNLGTATVTNITGAGSQLNLASSTANTSKLDLDATARLNVNGMFANADLGRTNTTYDVTSIVEYQDGATGGIITTASTNPYGNLKLNRTVADIQAENTNAVGGVNDINVATSIALAGGFDLDMLNGTGGYLNLQNASAGDVVYTGQEEVIGQFRRTHTFATATPYVYGNSATTVNFSTAPTGGTFFQVNMDKDGQTTQYMSDRDVQRDVNIAYDNSGFVAAVKVGYTQADVTGWNAAYTEDQIRFLEGELNTANFERIGTGQSYARTNAGAGTFGSVALPGITYTTSDVDGIGDAGFFSSNELILRAGPGVVASVQPGRWSNPATWDAGEQPLAFDSVLVRHNVWAGFTRTVDGFAGDELHPTELAAAINIISPDVANGFPTPTLMIGHSDADMVSNFETSTPSANGTGGVLIGALGATTPLIPSLTDEIPLVDVATNYVGGLLIFGNTSTAEIPELFVKGSVLNNGPLNIGGILSIGQ